MPRAEARAGLEVHPPDLATLWSAVLLFLFLLALRNQFKIKSAPLKNPSR